jgi:hypothetical protein
VAGSERVKITRKKRVIHFLQKYLAEMKSVWVDMSADEYFQ